MSKSKHATLFREEILTKINYRLKVSVLNLKFKILTKEAQLQIMLFKIKCQNHQSCQSKEEVYILMMTKAVRTPSHIQLTYKNFVNVI